MIIKRDGRVQRYDKNKLIKILNQEFNSVETLKIIEFIEKELEQRFEEFYPNTDNIKDMVEKYKLLEKSHQL
tara:strand:+ start:148 stop:363 length:216 start_codon:yes stop_codon:yes gene_type:complete